MASSSCLTIKGYSQHRMGLAVEAGSRINPFQDRMALVSLIGEGDRMRVQLQRCRTMTVTLVFVCLVVLQSVAGSFAFASSSPFAGLDSFGNPLCLSGAQTDGGVPGSKKDHQGLPDCCTAACSMFTAFAVESRTEHYLLVSASPSSDTLRPIVVGQSFAKQDHPPGNPRAPPAKA